VLRDFAPRPARSADGARRKRDGRATSPGRAASASAGAAQRLSRGSSGRATACPTRRSCSWRCARG
jgi:hypothetical protein